MKHFQEAASKVEAEMPLGIGRVQLIQKFWNEPIDVVRTAYTHHLELALLPRSDHAIGCFPEHWGPHRFEPIGEVFLMPARHMVHAKSDCRHQSSVVCNFDPAAVAKWFEGDLEWTDGRLRGSLNIVNAQVRGLLFRIGEELRNPGFGSETMTELMAAQAVVELSRHLLSIGERRAIGGLSPRNLKLIDERLGDAGVPPALSELAALCGLSVRHLTRAFRVSRGRSIGRYIAERRMDHAKQLLASGTCVKSVAYATGFTAPSNFSAAFLRATGETPRRYKERTNRKSDAAAAIQSKIH